MLCHSLRDNPALWACAECTFENRVGVDSSCTVCGAVSAFNSGKPKQKRMSAARELVKAYSYRKRRKRGWGKRGKRTRTKLPDLIPGMPFRHALFDGAVKRKKDSNSTATNGKIVKINVVQLKSKVLEKDKSLSENATKDDCVTSHDSSPLKPKNVPLKPLENDETKPTDNDKPLLSSEMTDGHDHVPSHYVAQLTSENKALKMRLKAAETRVAVLELQIMEMNRKYKTKTLE
eukprot:g1989.t1